MTGNIAKVCQKHGVNRRRFREKLVRFQENGVAGLADQRHSQNARIAGPAYDKVVAVALRNEGASSKMISYTMRLNGVKISPSSIQRILRKEGLTSKKARLERLEEIWKKREDPRYAEIIGDRASVQKVVERIATINPRVRMYKSRSTTPGARVVHDVHFVGVYCGQKYFCNMVIDTCSSYAIATLQTTDRAKEDYDFLLETLPTFAELGAPIQEINTDLNPRYDRLLNSLIDRIADKLKDGLKGKSMDKLKAEINFEHRRERCTPGRHLGYIDHFVRRVRTDFFNTPNLQDISSSFEQINTQFQHWLHQYNSSSSEGFPNFGQSPLQSILDSKGQQAEN
ncbi:hypothetical protein GEOBRER4_n2754 [Citrifermentans bremense]|uniref:Integrase catalytic domain-containing protein n=2 Tax=Citrifermentans bremense TaxID=60035 RepID=A0A7R7FTB1_9BACT|nr:hypothetical protein GEOBRER4_n2754 [Citrifermentans bremense]